MRRSVGLRDAKGRRHRGQLRGLGATADGHKRETVCASAHEGQAAGSRGRSGAALPCRAGLLWETVAHEHLQLDSLTSTSNGFLQHRCGQLIGDCQVLGVP